ncbi:toxic anion resistance protein [Bacillus sp. FJAT-42376]|uniref:toxic anion resistance protein n=1 Tax=Bacillus sp. FJAT-42376 TaxID=2014076 RepID=UPI000F4ED71D|nr:toxic anion resistance protein [Bacillus sp. FJAT-42376]AZB41568.1 toxic anion resistance protein [Bacillus sp. FJAT-42376]
MSMESSPFTESERKRVQELAAEIKPGMGEEIASFGVPAQSGILSLSSQMMNYVKEKDRGNAGLIIRDLMKKLDKADPDRDRKAGFLTRLFPKKYASREVISRYHQMSAQLDRAVMKLEKGRNVLQDDLAMLDEWFARNQAYFNELNLYIGAAETKLSELNKALPDLEKAEDRQKYEDTARFAERLDRRLYDLKVSREITRQSAPQIRLIQQTNQLLIDKIQTSILTSIPLWKNQITMASSALRRKNAGETKRTMGRLDGRAGTQGNLLKHLEESLEIQQEGQKQRETAEKKLAGLNGA